MTPPLAAEIEDQTNGSQPSPEAPVEPSLSESQAMIAMSKFAGPLKFEDKYEERDHLKGRLATAFRIFGKYGFDEGVAGHITLVSAGEDSNTNQSNEET